MKTISNITALIGGCSASLLFIVLFSETDTFAKAGFIPFSQLVLLLCGVLLLISGVVGLISSKRSLFLVCSILSLLAVLVGVILTCKKCLFAVMGVLLLVAIVFNLIVPKIKSRPKHDPSAESSEK